VPEQSKNEAKKFERTRILESAPVKTAIWKLSIPTMLAMLLQVIYNMTDTFFIGKLNNPDMVAAIALCMPVVMGIQAFGNIFAVGGASLISRLLGEGRRENANHAAAISFWASSVICVIITVLLYVFKVPMLKICGASENTLYWCIRYADVMLLAGAFMGLQVTLAGLLRSEGATTESMIGMVSGSILNIILDPIFIFWLGMDVAGAALATTIGNTVGFLYYLYFYVKKKGIISISPKYFVFRSYYFTNIFKIGIPASLDNLLMSVGMAVANSVAAGFSDILVAAFGVNFRLLSVGVMIAAGIGHGCQPLMGYSYGCGNHKRLLQTIRYSLLYALALGIFFGITFYTFSGSLIRAFINDADVVRTGAKFMRMMAIALPFVGPQMILRTLFQAIGKPIEALVLSLGRQGVFFIPAILVLSKLGGETGFMSAIPITDIFTTVLAVILLLFIRKKLQAQQKQADNRAMIDADLQ
jgi:putative MATE family efflux protein